MRKTAIAINAASFLALAGLGYFWLDSKVAAQCNGIFPANTLCGNLGPTPAPPAAFSANTSVVGPGITTSGNVAVWGNTAGTLLVDPARSNLLASIVTSQAVPFFEENEQPSVLAITQGSSTAATLTISPTVGISRRESINAIDTTGGQDAALFISNLGNNFSTTGHNAQVNGLTVKAAQAATGTGDVAAGFFISQNYGGITSGVPHQSTALFGFASSTNTSANIATAQIESSNLTGVDHDRNSSSTGNGYITPMDLVATGPNKSSYGILIRRDNGTAGSGFDSGIQIQEGTTRTISSVIFDVRASANSILQVVAPPFGPFTYATGIDLTNGTYTATFKSSGFAVSGSGTVNASGFSDNNFTVDVTGNTSAALLTGTTITGTTTISAPTINAGTTMNTSTYKVNGTFGVSCAAGTTSAATLTIVGGIVTHC